MAAVRRPVQAWHLETMAARLADSVHERVFDLMRNGADSPQYLRHRRAALRQREALHRLTEALDRDLRELRRLASGGESR